MRILIVLHKAKKKGGMVLQHLKMSEEFKKLGHEISIFSFDTYLVSKNVFADHIKILRELKAHIKKYKPSIILTSDPYFTTLFSLITKNKDSLICLRVGARYHPFYTARLIDKLSPNKMYVSLYFFINFILKQLDKLILRKANLVIFNSKYLKRYYSKYTRNSKVIYNGVSKIADLELKVNTPIKLIFVGRIEPRKSLEIIIQALCKLDREKIDFTFSLVGNYKQFPDYWLKIEKMIKRNNIKEKIILLNEIPNNDLPEILVKHDILLFSSDERNFPMTEGLPNVILEGMANGLAIIATPVAGVPEIISEENGYLVEPKPIEFANKIQLLSENTQKLMEIKNKNIQKIKNNFRITKTAENYLCEFEKF